MDYLDLLTGQNIYAVFMPFGWSWIIEMSINYIEKKKAKLVAALVYTSNRFHGL